MLYNNFYHLLFMFLFVLQILICDAVTASNSENTLDAPTDAIITATTSANSNFVNLSGVREKSQSEKDALANELREKLEALINDPENTEHTINIVIADSGSVRFIDNLKYSVFIEPGCKQKLPNDKFCYIKAYFDEFWKLVKNNQLLKVLFIKKLRI